MISKRHQSRSCFRVSDEARFGLVKKKIKHRRLVIKEGKIGKIMTTVLSYDRCKVWRNIGPTEKSKLMSFSVIDETGFGLDRTDIGKKEGKYASRH